ncbi:MAG: glycosyltransferase family 2 protein [Bacteroidota bacterium]
MQPIKVSVVVCVYNEQENIRPLVQQITDALKGHEYEIVYVDDGSTDGTLRELYALEHDRLRVVEFRKNYGQSPALMAGIDYAQGEYIVTMDGDLQNDPSDIPTMLALAEEGNYDMVAGNRANRKDGALFRKIPSAIANTIIRNIAGVHLKDYGCALKIIRAEVAKDLGLYGELHRFMPVLVALETPRITQIDVKHHARQFGQSKYGLGRTFKVLSDLMLMLFFKRYAQKPMHLFGNLGMFTFGIGSLISLYFAVLKLMGQDIWGRPLFILGFILIIAGIQFITIGILVEVQMRTYFESQQRRPYRVRNVKESKVNTSS